jgi:hypothetical protein
MAGADNGQNKGKGEIRSLSLRTLDISSCSDARIGYIISFDRAVNYHIRHCPHWQEISQGSSCIRRFPPPPKGYIPDIPERKENPYMGGKIENDTGTN